MVGDRETHAVGDPEAALVTARAAMAGVFATDDQVPSTLGEVILRPEQRVAAARIRQLIPLHGGAMLADPVGVGKTFVALAVARCYASVVIAAPAALRPMWTEALRRTSVAAQVISYEQLSRDGAARLSPLPDLVICDEAHHLRNPATRRHAAAAELCRDAHVLLLSATPVQNRLSDLAAPLALFLGARAFGMDPDELVVHVVRSAGAVNDAAEPLLLPRVDGPHLVTIDTPDDCLDALLALPPPTPANDEGDGGILLVYSLVRQWASSRAALGAALRRRLARAIALAAALESGRRPTRAELAAWSYAEGALQLAFPELVSGVGVDASRLVAAVQAQERAIRALLSDLANAPDPDLARVRALRGIQARHPGERIIAFSQFAETVRSFATRLMQDGGVVALTAAGARAAGGVLSRADVLAQFAPDAPAPAAAARIDLLLTTDVLSEGLDLQRASVVVHLDLPWNPARLEQRIGRARRLGSYHETVTVYAIAPPAAADRLLLIEQRLDAKLRLAGYTIGACGSLLPRSHESATDPGIAEQRGSIANALDTWRRDSPLSDTTAPVAAVEATAPGFVAVMTCSALPAPLLVADIGGGPSTLSANLLHALDLANGTAVAADESVLAAAMARLRGWWAAYRASASVDLGNATARQTLRAAYDRIDRIATEAPRHRRAELARVAAEARNRLQMRHSLGAERAIARLAFEEVDDERWLRKVARVTGTGSPATALPDEPPIRALILLQPRTPPAH